VAEAEFYKRFPARAKDPERWAGEIQKKAQEVARYALPVGTYCYLYHTVSALTLLRYHRLADTYDAPAEQRQVVAAMVDAVLAHDPEFAVLLEDPIPLEETLEYEFFQRNPARDGAAMGAEARREFDASLGGLVSRLVGRKPENESLLAAAVREVLGLPSSALTDDDAIALVMDPASNTALSGSLNVTTLSKLSRAMVHPSYTFRKRLSHTADSQDQRHRATPGSRPCLPAYLTPEPDYVTPALVPLDERVARRYQESMNRAWEAIGRLRALGVSDEFAAYLLPNAVSIRFTESADLLSLRHKCAMRLCLNAQEEIWRAARDESEQVRAADPRIGAYFLPPCGPRMRAGVKPFCPEGKRYCGVLRAQAEKKSPLVLWLLNLLWPGLGNLVVGEIGAGLLFGFAHWFFVGLTILTHGLGGFFCFGNYIVASAVGHQWIHRRYARALDAIRAKYAPPGDAA
jgi:thymidylate synthase ThyX/TM2 domain-containing membrane protein YozV